MKKILLTIAALGFIAQNLHAQQDTTKTKVKIKKDTVYRSLPQPLPSIPFPSGDWDGAPLVGTDATADNWPLTKLLGLTKSKVKIYGWADVGGNLSTSKKSNAPTSYDIVPNSVQLDQLGLKFDKEPDMAQTDHFDWGFLSTTIFGTDYRYTTGQGYFSSQLLLHNNLYGFDPSELYVMLYWPKIADGMVLKLGRYISPADIEAQWAYDNYLYSHSLMFTVDPYTFTGAQATFKLGSYWQLEVGVHAGNDMAPWSHSAQLNGLLMARWVSTDNKNSLYGGINALGDGDFTQGHDDLQMLVMTWGIKFNETFHMMTEAYYMWQYHALVGGDINYGPGQPFFEGTGAGAPIKGTMYAQGVVNYFQMLTSPKDYFSFRTDFLNDPQGGRTGYATLYQSQTLGFVHYFNKFIMVRPEIRWETAYADGVTPYDNGTKKSQWTLAGDVLVHF